MLWADVESNDWDLGSLHGIRKMISGGFLSHSSEPTGLWIMSWVRITMNCDLRLIRLTTVS